MSTSPPNNTLLIAIGIGAFLLMSRKSHAAGYPPAPYGAGAAQTSGGTVTGQLVSQGGNLLGQLINRFTGGAPAQGGYSRAPDYSPVNIPAGVNLFAGLNPANWATPPDTGVNLFAGLDPRDYL